MNRVFWAAFCFAGLFSTLVYAQTTGLDRMTDLWSLPVIEQGVVAYGESSHDLTGLNEDGFTGIFSRLYWDPGKHVLFDSQGPGCLYRMWFTFNRPRQHARLMLYIDNETTPSVNKNINEFFEGVTEPFAEPLVWDAFASSGGYVSYVPVCFQERLVVATSGPITFYGFTAHQYRGDVQLESFSGDEDYSTSNAIYHPERMGLDPKDRDGVQALTSDHTLQPGETWTFFQQDGAGQIAGLRLRPVSVNDDLLNRVRLRAFFDGADEPAVDVQLGMFFGATDSTAEVESLLFGIKNGILYNFYPMPFFTSATLQLVNDTQTPLPLEVETGLRSGMPDDHAGTFNAVYRTTSPTVFGRDHQFANLSGQGKVVGVVQIAGGFSGRDYLEGDERWYPDGLRTPTIQGTGTEDYYNGGWYFINGTFTLPTHGNPQHTVRGEIDTTGMYRLHVGDSLNFYRGADFSIEHGALNLGTNEIYRSCTFVYSIDEPALVFEDEFDVGVFFEEERFEYVGSDDTSTGLQMFFYEGDHDLAPYYDYGYQSKGTVDFTVHVNPHNDGLRLVRRLDQFRGGELVRVWVDGVDAGLWGTPEHNAFKRWRDSVFDLSPEFTKGKDAVRITLQNMGDYYGFSHYRYWFYSWKRPVLSRMNELILAAAEQQVHVGDSLQLYVDGAYFSGNQDEVTGWVRCRLSDPALADVVYGELIPLAPGKLTVNAYWQDLTSNEITITILPPVDDITDAEEEEGEAGEDNTASQDDENDSGCGC